MSADISLTSLDIAELVRNQHDYVKRTIRMLAIADVIRPPQLQAGELYVFTGEQGKRDSIVVAADLSPELTVSLVDRWQELETKVKGSEHAGHTAGCAFSFNRSKAMMPDISLRDYFAAAALQGLLACPGTEPAEENSLIFFPKRSYQYADAMLDEREKRDKQNDEKETAS